jgi:uncharacterized protein
MWETLLIGLAMVFVIEGVLPFLSPARWRSLFEQAIKLTDGQIRFFGLTSMLVGLVALLMLID